MQYERPKTSLLQMLLITILILLAIAFLVISLNTEDLLWFWPKYAETPAKIVVHCYGQDTDVNPGDAAFAALNQAVNENVSGSKRWDSLSLSDLTYEEYRTSSDMAVIELFYDPPVRIHSWYKFFKNFDTMIIPLDGRHAQANSVFGRMRELPVPGSFHIETTQPIAAALGSQGMCQIRK